jgi:hypothetical protein
MSRTQEAILTVNKVWSLVQQSLGRSQFYKDTATLQFKVRNPITNKSAVVFKVFWFDKVMHITCTSKKDIKLYKWSGLPIDFGADQMQDLATLFHEVFDSLPDHLIDVRIYARILNPCVVTSFSEMNTPSFIQVNMGH